MLDPRNVLRRGFTLTLQDGKIVKSASAVTEKEALETRFHDGTVYSQIINK
jgi:exodeoxyribonuclease VII large subunit